MIDKVKTKAETLAYELEEAMKKDLTEAIENLDTFVKVQKMNLGSAIDYGFNSCDFGWCVEQSFLPLLCC